MFFVIKNISGKHLCLLHGGLLVEVPEEQLDLGPGAVAEPELDVDPAVKSCQRTFAKFTALPSTCRA